MYLERPEALPRCARGAISDVISGVISNKRASVFSTRQLSDTLAQIRSG